MNKNDVVYRKQVLEVIELGMTVTQLEKRIMALPSVAMVHIDDLLKSEIRIRELEARNAQLELAEQWEDRSAIQSTNPGLAELIKEQQAQAEIERLRKELVRQHDHFTGKLVPDLTVTTGTDYEDNHPR